MSKIKKVLITGANSYLGENTKRYLEQSDRYQVDILDMLDPNWKNKDFSFYDVVFNVCAIVHQFHKVDESIYFKVNKDLALEIAIKAKKSGVKQFIQTSTVGVFGIELGEMNSSMGFNPKTPYEKSKYAADLELEKLRDESFKVCIIRPPMIYGNGCKGNFPKLERFALRHHIFPSIKNKRDFIYIENICDFIKYAIDMDLNEICYPKNNEQNSVAELVKLIAKYNGKKMLLLGIFNPLIKLFYKCSKKLRSVFGNCYCTDIICSNCIWSTPYSLEESVKRMYEKNITL